MAAKQCQNVWRWDQGRGQYFKFDAIKKMAKVLANYNGANMDKANDLLRKDLEQATGLPFSPVAYTIKRNYKRVFECSLLATYIGKRLIVSDICQALAAGDKSLQTPDAYLYELERRFRYPFPAFDNYRDFKGICFPFFAIIKLLMAKSVGNMEKLSSVSLKDIGSMLIANDVTGLENMAFYKRLQPRSFSFESDFSNDQKRQVREMMALLGQHSYIGYSQGRLTLAGLNEEERESAFLSMTPISTDIASMTPVDDFVELTKYRAYQRPETRVESEDASSLENFSVSEGRKVFTSHLKIERDASLRRKYIRLHPQPVCDVCGRNMHVVYPWTENMLEIHHLKPLSSFEEGHETSLKDVVGLCPSCHRAIHIYYRGYLKKNDKEDFDDAAEAITAYNEAKSKVRK